MLVLSRKKNESIVINNDITITVVDLRGDKVRLGIVHPREMPVHRLEVYEAIHGKSSLLTPQLPTPSLVIPAAPSAPQKVDLPDRVVVEKQYRLKFRRSATMQVVLDYLTMMNVSAPAGQDVDVLLTEDQYQQFTAQFRMP